jgi:hypothetical protein
MAQEQEHHLGMTDADYKRGILEILNKPYARGSQMVGDANTPSRKAHKINIIGRNGMQSGELEAHVSITFDEEMRARAGRCFDELRRDSYIEPSYDDLVDPEGWVRITALGRDYLARDMRDGIDDGLMTIGSHLVELRRGMKDAVARTSDDSPRQAANAARELIDQVLKDGTPADLKTRKERFKHLMNVKQGNTSKTSLEILEANAELLEAEHNNMVKEAHGRHTPATKDARACVDAAERILGLIFEV